MSEPEPSGASQLEVELMRQIDAVCRRFEADWRAGARPPFDSYLAEVPDQARPALRTELEALDRELRQPEETVGRAEVDSAPLAPTEAYRMVVEQIVELDEELMMRYLEGETIEPEVLRKAAHDAIAGYGFGIGRSKETSGLHDERRALGCSCSVDRQARLQ